MLITLGEKRFRLRKFSPTVGRELMLKGKGIRDIVKNPEQWLLVLSHVDVRVAEGRWVPLATKAMVLNHLQPQQVEELFMLQLTDNCFCIRDLLSAPPVGESIKEMFYDIIEEAAANVA